MCEPTTLIDYCHEELGNLGYFQLKKSAEIRKFSCEEGRFNVCYDRNSSAVFG